MHRLRTSLAAAAAATAMFAAAGAASAESGVKIGTLSCNVAPGIGFIVGSSKSMECQFSGSAGIEVYSGVINKFGIDIGVTGNQVLNWVVFAPGEVDPGALAGTYIGATAEATAAVGAGANVLVGGFNSSIALQPLSVSTQTGLNIAAGVAELVLHPR
ncbi:MAG TPA: DUF992 domain-containing protein [Aestuariivirgaceae bacterium]|nr:DUF992 domain-containing protein [Aestuariivirgaceae bacterium]